MVTSSAGDFREKPGALTPEQEQRLLAVHADASLGCAGRDLFGELVSRIHSILFAAVVIIRKEDRRWTIVAGAGSDPPADLVASFAPALDGLTAGAPAIRATNNQDGRTPWTLVACVGHPLSIIAIRGDWTLSLAAFALLARNVGHLLETRAERDRARSGLSAHRLARRLSRARGLREVYEAIVHRMPMAVHARIAALAVPDPSDGRLAIVATHGYPRELVEHLRIEPKSSIFGSVFQSGRVLHVKGFDQSSSLRRRRPRYRTDSFVAIPLVGGRDVLGVICVTDRRDDKPFTAEDVSILRAMAAPAALALGREHALVQAEGFALTAAIDPLSGAFNRRHFHMRLEEELQRSRRHSLSLGFLMIDIDDFKTVNDSFGHLAGDAVIRDVAEILRRSVRVFDVCARFGGEEFAIIMPGSVVESAAMVAERIRERIESYRPSDSGLETVSLTVSIGLAVSSPGMSGHDLIETADRALYLAKRAGKNRVRVASRDDGSDRSAGPPENRESDPDAPGF